MKQQINKTCQELKLRYRFACRRLGIPGYQVHQIYLSEYQLLYIPIPKNACTSIKQALQYIEFGTLFDAKRKEHAAYTDVHDYYKKRPGAFTGIRQLKAASRATRFAIVRDPVERLISCYRNRVVDLGDLRSGENALKKKGLSAEPDLNTFVLNLETYRKASKSIEHHSRPQSAFLGGTFDYLDHIYPIEEIENLHAVLKQFAPGLELLNRKSGGAEFDVSDLSPDALEYAIGFYQDDYNLLKDFYTPQAISEKYNRQRR